MVVVVVVAVIGVVVAARITCRQKSLNRTNFMIVCSFSVVLSLVEMKSNKKFLINVHMETVLCPVIISAMQYHIGSRSIFVWKFSPVRTFEF